MARKRKSRREDPRSPKSYNVCVRADTRSRVEELAAHWGLSLNDTIDRLLNAGLDLEEERAGPPFLARRLEHLLEDPRARELFNRNAEYLDGEWTLPPDFRYEDPGEIRSLLTARKASRIALRLNDLAGRTQGDDNTHTHQPGNRVHIPVP